MRHLKISHQFSRVSFQLTFNNNRNSINFAFYRRSAQRSPAIQEYCANTTRLMATDIISLSVSLDYEPSRDVFSANVARLANAGCKVRNFPATDIYTCRGIPRRLGANEWVNSIINQRGRLFSDARIPLLTLASTQMR